MVRERDIHVYLWRLPRSIMAKVNAVWRAFIEPTEKHPEAET